MSTLFDNDRDLDLRCDFPARESFRASLLEQLQSANERGGVLEFEDPAEIRCLTDDELEMLAAAGDPSMTLPDLLQ